MTSHKTQEIANCCIYFLDTLPKIFLMKKLFPIALAALLIVGFSQFAQAQKFPSLDKSSLDIAYYPQRAATRGAGSLRW